MSDIKDKLKKTLSQKPEVKPAISDWQSLNVDENLHIKYDPSDKNQKTHLDAILADINEDSLKIEEYLNQEYELKKLATKNLGFLGDISDIGLGLTFSSEAEAKAEKRHREELKRERENMANTKKGKDA